MKISGVAPQSAMQIPWLSKTTATWLPCKGWVIVTVRLRPLFGLRVRVGAWLMKLAARLMRARLHVSEPREAQQPSPQRSQRTQR